MTRKGVFVMTEHFNVRVAAARGRGWIEALKRGKMRSRLNPSLLSELRKDRGLRQIDVATRLEMSLSSYCAVERGERPVKEFIAMHISTEMGLRVADLFEPAERLPGKYMAILREELPPEMRPQHIGKIKVPKEIRQKKKELEERKAKEAREAKREAKRKEKARGNRKPAGTRVSSKSGSPGKKNRLQRPAIKRRKSSRG